MTRATVTYCGVRLECEFDYEPAEHATRWEPGSPAIAALTSCKVNGAEILDMLTSEQQDEIETLLADQAEDAAREHEYERRQERLMEMQYP